MKLDKIFVKHFLGVVEIDLALATPVTLFCGANGAGKSSIRDAVALALTGDLGRVSLKKEAAQLVQAGTNGAACEVETADGDTYVTTISNAGKLSSSTDKSGFDPILPYVLDAQRFAGLSANDRRSFMLGLMDVKTDPAAVKALLAKRGCDAGKVDRVATMLRAGFDAACKEAKAKATEAKGAWRALTGEAFGSEKAKLWRAEVPKYDAGKLKELQTELQHADVAIGQWQQEVGKLQSEQQRRAGLQTKLTALREHASRIERIQTKLATDEQQLTEWERDLAKTMAAAGEGPARVGVVHELAWALDNLLFHGDPLTPDDPHAPRINKALADYEREHGKVCRGDENKAHDAKATARLPSIRASVELSTKAVANDRRDLDAAKAAQAEVATIEAELAQPLDAASLASARAQIETLQGQRADVAKRLDGLQSLKLQAEAADKRTKDAAAHADDVAQWDHIGDALAPDGIPGEILAQALGPINERLAQSAADTGWLVANITADMAVTGGERDYRLLSESEQWRVDAMVAEAITHLSGMRLLVLDRFDVLDPASRADLIGWLDVLANTGELDTGLVFGTLKALPATLPETIAAHWIENGVVADNHPQQLKAAA
jgi:hypothetical protein